MARRRRYAGQFALNDKWVWADGVAVSDIAFFRGYNLGPYRNALSSFLLVPDTGLSQLYLTGVGNRSYSRRARDALPGYSGADIQSQIPEVHPVIDYSNILNWNVFGGEVSYKGNFESEPRHRRLRRHQCQRQYQQPLHADIGRPDGANAANCLPRGAAGDYTRLSVKCSGGGRTPIRWVRSHAVRLVACRPHQRQHRRPAGVSNFIPTGTEQVARIMPTVGLEYRYPFINVQPWGSTTIEPIGQIIIRPNETSAGRLPNEDAQSLTFDDSNLFRVDKFAGWDRVEGGGRANVGVQATTQFDRGGFINVLFGQSYHLFGLNSYAVPDPTNTGIGSGLDTTRSDYVGRISYQPNSTFNFSTRVRLDESTLRSPLRG